MGSISRAKCTSDTWYRKLPSEEIWLFCVYMVDLKIFLVYVTLLNGINSKKQQCFG